MNAHKAENDWVATGPGTRRRILADAPQLMLVEFEFQDGGVGELHSHPHVQATYVASGEFEFSVGGETRVLSKGQSLIVESGVVHGCIAKKGGSLIDSFAPGREDFR